MTKRECPLLVLSPHARSPDQVQRFKPFGGSTLVDIIRQVATALSYRKSLRYERHAIFSRFFFGATVLDESLIPDLREVPSSLVDCRMYNSEETNALETARKALAAVTEAAPVGGKLVVFTCNHGWHIEISVTSELARSDEALFAHLWMDLCGGAFRKIGEVLARRWGD
jgi:hypothetical protein